jgi:cytochrome c oxidase subunit 2
MNMLSSLNLLASADLPSVAPRPGSFWLPTQASTGAAQTDLVFYFIYWVSVFFFILIVALMVYFVIRYRRRREGELPANQVTHNTTLEITWSAIPLVLVVIMFYLGFRGFIDISPGRPRDSLDIRVEASKWAWWFNYPNGHGDNELHVPVDHAGASHARVARRDPQPLHSGLSYQEGRGAGPLQLASGSRPRRPASTWLLCAEYCGTQHSDMLAKVVVHEPGKLRAVARERLRPVQDAHAGGGRRADVPETLCGCHSIDGTANVGPTRSRTSTAKRHSSTTARPLTIEDNYIRESILYPQRKIVRATARTCPPSRASSRTARSRRSSSTSSSGVPARQPEVAPAEPAADADADGGEPEAAGAPAGRSSCVTGDPHEP